LNTPITVWSQRVENVRQFLASQQIDALMVTVQENRHYLSGFRAGDGQFDETAGVLIIGGEYQILVTDSRYELEARHQTPQVDVRCYRKKLAQYLADMFQELGIRRLGFESKRVTVQQHQELDDCLKTTADPVTLVPVEDVVEKLRLIKDQQEVEHTRGAIALAEAAFEHLLGVLVPGMTEIEVAWELEQHMRRAGADEVSFPVIVAAGPNSALPHAVPSRRAISEDEPLLIDWGARLRGYCSDTSRTVIIGRASDRFSTIYRIVHEAQQKAIAAMRPGISTRQVDSVARDHIAAAGYGEYFGHGLGHGTGLAIHEAPRLSPLSKETLQPGMICTVEPGIYLPDWGGIRLENQVVITENGVDVLTTLPLGDYVV
jgi:Xaa-Pro aminopeptidase